MHTIPLLTEKPKNKKIYYSTKHSQEKQDKQNKVLLKQKLQKKRFAVKLLNYKITLNIATAKATHTSHLHKIAAKIQHL